MSPARIETLADGVFAIAMTLLAFDLVVPEVVLGEDPVAVLPGLIGGLLGRFALYAISFVVLGVYWVAHHAQFRVIDAADRSFLWINILFVMLIAFVPFATSLLARYWNVPVAVQFYGVVLILIGGSAHLHWWYATKEHRLIPPSTSDEFIARIRRRILIAPAVCTVAILVAFVSTVVSIMLYAVLVLFYIAPGKVDATVFGRRRGV